jgi:cell division protein FtsB
MSSSPVPSKAPSPIEEAINQWFKTPKSYINFFKQRRTIIKTPEILDATELPNWSSPLAFAGTGIAIVLIIVHCVIWGYNLTTQQSLVSATKAASVLQAKRAEQNIEQAKLQQNLDDLQHDSPTGKYKLSNDPTLLSQAEAISKISTELTQMSEDSSATEQSISILKWGQILTEWYQAFVIPLALGFAGFRFQKLLSKYNTRQENISAKYLYLSSSYGFGPSILSGLLLGVLFPLMDAGFSWATYVYGFAALSGMVWYQWSLNKTGNVLARSLGLTASNDIQEVIKAVTRANYTLAIIGEVFYFLSKSLLDAALKG